MDILNYYQALGLHHWQLRKTNLGSSTLSSRSEENTECASQEIAITAQTDDWSSLKNCVSQCTACSLHQTRTQTVFGVGDQHAQLMIVGEAPGFHEDQQGEPFVGRAGQLLTAMLKAIGFTRQQVYIANILKCRPPNNRDPEANEVQQCTPFLDRQISLVQPRLMLAVGRIAAHHLLKTKSSLEMLRNKLHQYGEIPLIVTYHPAYLLRNPIDKKKAFSDLQFTMRTLKTIAKT